MLNLSFNGREVVQNIRELGFWTKMIGLEGGVFGDKIYFKTRFGIHTFGLYNSIDVLVLGKDGRVGAVFQNLGPNQMRFWNPKFEHVFELPAGTLKRVENIKTGIFMWYDRESI